MGEQNTFEQLATMYSEQEKLERALGVSEADQIIEMVEALTAQLDDIYADRDTAQSGDAPTYVSGDSAAPRPDHDRTSVAVSDEPAPSPNGDAAMTSMQDQLESLYAEKETLLDHGLTDAQAAVDQIDDLEAQVQTLRAERDRCRERFDHLASALGTTDPDEIVAMAQGPTDASAEGSAPAEPPPEASEKTAGGEAEDPASDDVRPLLPDEQLRRLDEMSEAELGALDVGLLRLDDDGHITYLNEAARALPGLDEDAPREALIGRSLFLQVPGTSNTLFLRPFREGVETGSMDARFPYAFVSPEQPPMPFHVHLYRAAPSGANWLLLRSA
jgi:photoactive yellow protein